MLSDLPGTFGSPPDPADTVDALRHWHSGPPLFSEPMAILGEFSHVTGGRVILAFESLGDTLFMGYAPRRPLPAPSARPTASTGGETCNTARTPRSGGSGGNSHRPQFLAAPTGRGTSTSPGLSPTLTGSSGGVSRTGSDVGLRPPALLGGEQAATAPPAPVATVPAPGPSAMLIPRASSVLDWLPPNHACPSCPVIQTPSDPTPEDGGRVGAPSPAPAPSVPTGCFCDHSDVLFGRHIVSGGHLRREVQQPLTSLVARAFASGELNTAAVTSEPGVGGVAQFQFEIFDVEARGDRRRLLLIIIHPDPRELLTRMCIIVPYVRTVIADLVAKSDAIRHREMLDAGRSDIATRKRETFHQELRLVLGGTLNVHRVLHDFFDSLLPRALSVNSLGSFPALLEASVAEERRRVAAELDLASSSAGYPQHHHHQPPVTLSHSALGAAVERVIRPPNPQAQPSRWLTVGRYDDDEEARFFDPVPAGPSPAADATGPDGHNDGHTRDSMGVQTVQGSDMMRVPGGPQSHPFLCAAGSPCDSLDIFHKSLQHEFHMLPNATAIRFKVINGSGNTARHPDTASASNVFSSGEVVRITTDVVESGRCFPVAEASTGTERPRPSAGAAGAGDADETSQRPVERTSSMRSLQSANSATASSNAKQHLLHTEPKTDILSLPVCVQEAAAPSAATPSGPAAVSGASAATPSSSTCCVRLPHPATCALLQGRSSRPRVMPALAVRPLAAWMLDTFWYSRKQLNVFRTSFATILTAVLTGSTLFVAGESSETPAAAFAMSLAAILPSGLRDTHYYCDNGETPAHIVSLSDTFTTQRKVVTFAQMMNQEQFVLSTCRATGLSAYVIVKSDHMEPACDTCDETAAALAPSAAKPDASKCIYFPPLISSVVSIPDLHVEAFPHEQHPKREVSISKFRALCQTHGKEMEPYILPSFKHLSAAHLQALATTQPDGSVLGGVGVAGNAGAAAAAAGMQHSRSLTMQSSSVVMTAGSPRQPLTGRHRSMASMDMCGSAAGLSAPTVTPNSVDTHEHYHTSTNSVNNGKTPASSVPLLNLAREGSTTRSLTTSTTTTGTATQHRAQAPPVVPPRPTAASEAYCFYHSPPKPEAFTFNSTDYPEAAMALSHPLAALEAYGRRVYPQLVVDMIEACVRVGTLLEVSMREAARATTFMTADATTDDEYVGAYLRRYDAVGNRPIESVVQLTSSALYPQQLASLSQQQQQRSGNTSAPAASQPKLSAPTRRRPGGASAAGASDSGPNMTPHGGGLSSGGVPAFPVNEVYVLQLQLEALVAEAVARGRVFREISSSIADRVVAQGTGIGELGTPASSRLSHQSSLSATLRGDRAGGDGPRGGGGGLHDDAQIRMSAADVKLLLDAFPNGIQAGGVRSGSFILPASQRGTAAGLGGGAGGGSTGPTRGGNGIFSRLSRFLSRSSNRGGDLAGRKTPDDRSDQLSDGTHHSGPNSLSRFTDDDRQSAATLHSARRTTTSGGRSHHTDPSASPVSVRSGGGSSAGGGGSKKGGSGQHGGASSKAKAPGGGNQGDENAIVAIDRTAIFRRAVEGNTDVQALLAQWGWTPAADHEVLQFLGTSHSLIAL